jgi:hypothetical protein
MQSEYTSKKKPEEEKSKEIMPGMGLTENDSRKKRRGRNRTGRTHNIPSKDSTNQVSISLTNQQITSFLIPQSTQNTDFGIFFLSIESDFYCFRCNFSKIK